MAEGGKVASTSGSEVPPEAPSSTPTPGLISGPRPAAGASSPPAPVDPLIGRVISGRFKVVGLIARGGMGRVYRAEQAPLGRVCALKILTTTYEGEHDPEFHKRFFLEASIASKITHPNSVTIFDYGQTEDDIYYMAMEYLEGVTLHRAIRMAGFFPEARVAHIGRQVCRALREAHALGCIHRDLKPANIFLTEHGDEPDFVKVLDFGLVKNVLGEKPDEQLTQTGLFMGSPKYMAPEQIRGERVDVRTDVYSLGIIMYEMLTGKVPFERQTSLNTLMAQVNDRPPRLQETNPAIEVSPEVEDLVYRCMAKDPAERIASMDEVLAILRRIVEPGHGLSGEYRALGSTSSGPYSKAEPTPGPSRPPTSISAIAAARTGDGQSVSVTMSDGAIRAPSMTPMSGGSVTSPSLPPPDFRHGGLRNAFLGGFGLVLVGGLVALALRSQEPVAKVAAPPLPVSATPASSEAASVTAAPVVSAPTPPVVTTLSVHFTTEPAGASVKEGAVELCAATPCDYAFPADMTAEHKVLLSHPGFKPETRVLHGTDSHVSVTFAPQRAWTPPVRPATPKPPEGTTPQGFKDIPY